MFLLIASFLAGVLTSLAPCILPLLPVIVGSSMLKDGDQQQDKWKPYIIAASLVVSVIVFTFLLKASTVLIGIDPQTLTVAAGLIVVLLGLTMLFPMMWVRLSARVGLESGSNKLLTKANKRSGLIGAILTGAALGPVFSSCSPVYALILATVLPVNIALGMVYITFYALGLGLALLAIALIGRRLTSRLGWAINPSGVFRKTLAIILILVGLFVMAGWVNKLQVWAGDHLPFATTSLEDKLIPKAQNSAEAARDNSVFNVAPYQAANFNNIAGWINSNPLTINELKGKVVLVDFWTYSCINCQRTQPYLNKWYDRYRDNGFVIVGVHAPEFAFEKVKSNVQDAVKRENIKYPVALDNDFATWNAYNNQFWPAKYLIDKDGQVRFTHFGEGEYDTTERAIQALLKESGHAVNDKIEDGSNARQHLGQTAETYLGYQRAQNFASRDQFVADQTVNYDLATDTPSDFWALGGKWRIGGSETTATGQTGHLRLNFSAKEVYLVMDGPPDQLLTMTLNGQKVTAANNGGKDVDSGGNIYPDGPRMYKLIKLPEFRSNQILDISVPKGVSVNAFTFGG